MSDMSKQTHGVVVVGIGSAGKARLRDLKVFTSHVGLNWSLKGFVSRRHLEIEDLVQMTLEETLSSAEVTIVVICTEPSEHESVIRKCLECGKHVLVEFPMTLSTQSSQELFKMATEKGVVLHEEDIGMLLPSLSETKEQVKSHSLQSLEINQSASYNGWIEKIGLSGLPFLTTISLMHELYEVFGDLEVIGGHLEVTGSGFTATANLLTQNKKPISIRNWRSKEKVARKKDVRFTFDDGTVYEPVNPGPPKPQPGAELRAGLFMRDFFQFIEKVKGERAEDADRQRTLKCMELVDKIHSFIK